MTIREAFLAIFKGWLAATAFTAVLLVGAWTYHWVTM